MVEELIAAAVNAATGKARQLIGDELRRATGGLDIPGLNDLLGGSRSDRSPES
jgi:DNA-binding protein YbaB